ncbi:MAG: hypothetical protein ABR540_18895 [Acidimicrobiales bacterium]
MTRDRLSSLFAFVGAAAVLLWACLALGYVPDPGPLAAALQWLALLLATGTVIGVLVWWVLRTPRPGDGWVAIAVVACTSTALYVTGGGPWWVLLVVGGLSLVPVALVRRRRDLALELEREVPPWRS